MERTDADKIQRVVADDEFGYRAMRAAYRHYVAGGGMVSFEVFEHAAHIYAGIVRIGQ